MLGHTYTLSTGETLFVVLVSNIKNYSDLKKKVINQELQCGFITPNLILDSLQIAIAADKAALARNKQKLITKNVYSEILFNLSFSKHISKSLNKFGGQENDSNLIVVYIGEEDGLKHVLSQVDGTEENITNLTGLANHKNIQKEYNIKPPEPEVSTLLDSVISRIAAKSMLI